MKFNLHDDLQSVLTALRHYRRALVGNRRVLALIALAVVCLAGVVAAYLSDARLHRGPWQSYAGGLFSVQEGRQSEHFMQFQVPDTFRRALERRGGGRLLAAYQKSVFQDNGDLLEIRHINVFDLAWRFGGRNLLSARRRVYDHYLGDSLPALSGCAVQRLPDIDGHPALSYRDTTRDSEGYYSMGIVLCAHKRAYFYEIYSHYSPYADWWNDRRTYTCQPHRAQGFTPDNMDHVELRFLLTGLGLLALFLGVVWVIYNLFTREVRRQGLPVVRPLVQQHYSLAAGVLVVLALSMLVLVGSLWLFKGANVLALTAYVVAGLLILGLGLPVLIHLYRKCRTPLP